METKSRKFRKLRNNLKRDEVIAAEFSLSHFKSSTVNKDKFVKYPQERAKVIPVMKAYYLNEDRPAAEDQGAGGFLPFRQMKLSSFINQQQAVKRLTKNLRERFENDTILIVGNWSAGNVKYHEPIKGVGMRRMLAKEGFQVYLLDEFRTSSLCPSCQNGELETFKKVQDPRPYQRENYPIADRHGLLRYKNQQCLKAVTSTIEATDKVPLRRLWNRDIAATLNFRRILFSLRANGDRPERFCKSKKPPSTGPKRNYRYINPRYSEVTLETPTLVIEVDESEDDPNGPDYSDEDVEQMFITSDLTTKTDGSIRKYSPARHGIICGGDNISRRPYYLADIYNEYRKKKDAQQAYSINQEVRPYIDQLMGCLQEYKKDIADAPNTEDAIIVLHYLVKPNLKTICNAIDHSKFNWAKVGFFDGEEELVSMTKQLKRKGSFVDHRFIYKADGVVRLQEAHDIEICLVEASGKYLNQETRKIHFDHHKANYGCLAMLKTIADQYKYASVDVFEQLKIYFVHAADNKIKLWSLSYQDEVFHFWREGVLNIEPKFEDKEMYQQDAINYYWTFKCKLEETLDIIKKIQVSHKSNIKKNRYNSGETPKSLSEIINPSIIKLTENDHKKGMTDLGPFGSSEHD
ncbi:hypothetical protein G6F49_004678 [Rhizopus delemar]|nr:hypothetical protein G6F49_004678 [Rhizopus delemar]KAG1594618.1 hypothetical protein G6F48_001258 [Rhizopus delemar]KAG1632780.1 hypothetical protein G6F44_010616 [Rhizopus delemar]